MTYEKMSAQELHGLVTRLEAHGFRLPEGVAISLNHWWYGLSVVPASVAAAIIEIAARDWWIARDRAMKPSTMIEWMTLRFDVAYGNGVSMHGEGPWDYPPELGEGMTPLHAIVAAVEATEGK